MNKSLILAILILSLGINTFATSNLDPSADSLYAILLPQLNGPNHQVDSADLIFIDGIVFYQSPIWKPEEDFKDTEKWSEYRDEYVHRTGKSDAYRLPDLNIEAKHLYLSGCLNSVDIGSPMWGGGDGYRNFFLGDTAGTLSISYRSGATDVIPLVFGYTAWWHESFQTNFAPFRSDAEARMQLTEVLCVVNGLDGYNRNPEDYYLKIGLRDEAVSYIELEDNPERIGYYQVNGLSFGGIRELEDREHLEDLDRGTFLIKKGLPVSKSRTDSVRELVIYSADPYPEQRRRVIESLRHTFYTTLEDINDSTISETPQEVRPEDFPGPKVTFTGSTIATLLTRIYYENSMQILGRIDADGMVHESEKSADNYQGFGGWNPDLGAFYDWAFTRNRSLTVLGHCGFKEKVNASIGFFDKWMMYFPESYPEVQLGGKPVPGHATVVPNIPHLYFDFLQNVGWKTKYKTNDFGNPENDGHGFLMITRYRAWAKQGRTSEWIDERWEAINEAAEYIPWCLDNPELSFSAHGLLHNETEGGMMGQSMFCDYLCYLGLQGYAEMAEASGRPNKAENWRDQADRLNRAMEAYYPAEIEPWGDVWDPKKNAIFSYVNSTLAPACIGMDYYGYDVMNLLSKEWAERTRRTYQMQLTRNRPDFAAPAGIGYGQCYITQTGLLLDQMNDADKMVEWMARLCFTPRLKHPYRVPEASVISEDGSTWRRWGDLGNLYQMVDVVHTIHLMIGIDDIDPAQLTLMPRITKDIHEMDITDWPVRIQSQDNSVLAELSMQMKVDPDGGEINCQLSSSHPIDHARIRLGPFPAGSASLKVLQNEKEVPFTRINSGDSGWVWISFGGMSTEEYDFRIVPETKHNNKLK